MATRRLLIGKPLALHQPRFSKLSTKLCFCDPHLSRCLAAAIQAERDIEHGLWSDPAFDHWLRAAELAWEQATKLCPADLAELTAQEKERIRGKLDQALRRAEEHLRPHIANLESLARLLMEVRELQGPSLDRWLRTFGPDN